MMRILLFIATNLAVVLVASITLSLLGVDSYMTAQGMDYGNLLAFCLVFGMAGSVISLLISKWMAKRSMGVQIIENASNADEQWLISTVQELADKARIGMPEVGIFASPQANAFATGWNRNNALVAVSTGLLNKMSREEVKAVLGHENGHVANGDMDHSYNFFKVWLNAFCSCSFARFLVSLVFKDQNSRGMASFAMTIVAEMILGILASTIVFWFSRRREYRADIAGAELVSPASMASALMRLKSESEQPSNMPDEMVAFGISGEMKNKLGGLFMSHPPLDDRINALKKRYQ